MPKVVDHEARRRELIEASWAVIAAEGLEGVTMRKIAAAAGCTTGRLTHYFKDREALILAALRAINDVTGERVRKYLRENDGKESLIEAAAEALPLDGQRLAEWKVWLAFWAAAATDPDLAAENDRRQEEWLDEIRPVLSSLAPGCDAAYEAERLLALVNGLGLRAAVSPTPHNRKTARDIFERHLGAILP